MRALGLGLALLVAACGRGGERGGSLTVEYPSMAIMSVEATPSSIRVEWDVVDGAQGYILDRNGRPYLTLGGLDTAWVDNFVYSGELYRYRVHALTSTGHPWPFDARIIAQSETIEVRTPDVAGWTIERWAGKLRWISNYDLAADPAGGMHRILCNSQSGYLDYARITDGGTDEVALVHGCGSALARGADGSLHIVHRDIDFNYHYLHRASDGIWRSEPLGLGSMEVRGVPEIAVDADGTPHAVLHERFGSLHYAVRRNGTWTVAPIEADHEVKSLDFAVESDGTAHILWINWDNGGPDTLEYATNESGVWQRSQVHDDVAADVACRIGPQGELRAMTYLQEPRELVHFTRSGTDWTFERIVETPGSREAVAFDFDSEGFLHVGYVAYNEDVLYATNASGAWTTEYVHADGQVGTEMSLLLEADGRIHLVYYDLTETVLWHAFRP